MKLSKEEFRKNIPPITLMGMSGVGKTYLSGKLYEWGWTHYSCDLEIGTTILGDEIVETLSRVHGKKVENRIKADDLSQLSEFVSRLGNVEHGALPLAEFKRRQHLYYQAECTATERFIAMSKAQNNNRLVNDSTGSLCEIEDDDLHDRLGAVSLYVYIEATPEEQREVLRRAQIYPKPLFFPPSQFDAWLMQYMAERHITDDQQIEPDDFSRWVFPFLFDARLPKYQRLAERHGVTISSQAFTGISSEEQFLTIIEEHLNEARGNLHRRSV